jgi:hypothetical protein
MVHFTYHILYIGLYSKLQTAHIEMLKKIRQAYLNRKKLVLRKKSIKIDCL